MHMPVSVCLPSGQSGWAGEALESGVVVFSFGSQTFSTCHFLQQGGCLQLLAGAK
jgi:hypothetical protein